MPTYVYKFVETGETIEVQQAFTDDCPHRGRAPRHAARRWPVKKVFLPVGVTFKGGGFYKTDSRSSKKSGSGSSGSDSKSESSRSRSPTPARRARRPIRRASPRRPRPPPSPTDRARSPQAKRNSMVPSGP